ncbi:MAG: SPOR domain-containing protein [Gammaproteobacteria bacterium]|nr:SPOR domain-containing protein [Gammaproteobacteria bacterium]
MKWIFRDTVTAAALMIFCAPSFSANIHVIYGLQKANHFHAATTGDYYIQTNSFRSPKKAEHYKNLLHSKTSYPVTVTHHDNYNNVMIGPIHSAAEVRKVANETLTTPVRHSHDTEHSTLQQKTTITDMSNHSRSNWFVAFSGGMQHPRFNSNIRINNGSDFPAPYSSDVYSTKNKNEPVFALSAGRHFETQNRWLPAYWLGLTYQNVLASNAGRTVMQYSSPEFINYRYREHISSNVFLAFVKMNLLQYRMVTPYIKVGAGLALNRSSDYAETALPGVTPRTGAGFSSETTEQFAYNAGLGIDVAFTRQISASLGYEYLNLGHVNSGQGKDAWSSQSLNFGSYQSNQILLSVNYLFE